MEKPQLELTMTTFIMSHFSYCPLVWMFRNSASNNKINKIHERALRIIQKDCTSNFQELLNKSNSVSVHQRNLQLLLTEIYKTVHNLNPPFMTQVFEEKDHTIKLSGKQQPCLSRSKDNVVWHRHHQVYWKKIMAGTANRIKRSQSLEIFKQKVTLIRNFDCSCRMCQNFFQASVSFKTN